MPRQLHRLLAPVIAAGAILLTTLVALHVHVPDPRSEAPAFSAQDGSGGSDACLACRLSKQPLPRPAGPEISCALLPVAAADPVVPAEPPRVRVEPPRCPRAPPWFASRAA